MARRSRFSEAGFTLVELLIAVVLFLTVSALTYGSLQLMQRTTRAQSERTAVQGNLRNAVQILTAELGELQVNTVAGTTDIAALSDSSITYRAMRATGMTCDLTSNDVYIRIANGMFSNSRALVAGRDSLLLFVDTDTMSVADDQWVALRVINSSASTCPDGSAALRIQTNGVPTATTMIPGPVRTFEVMQLARLRNGGRTWLGGRSASAGQAITPVLGPVDSAAGIQFAYYNGVGSATTLPAAVRQVEVLVRGVTTTTVNEGMSAGPGTVRSDSLRVRFAVRNSR